MTKIAFLSDVHVGNHKGFGGEIRSGINERCRLVLDVLHRAMSTAYDVNSAHPVILGDLFDVPKPSPQVLGAVMHVLKPAEDIDLLLGNHEITSLDPNDHAMYPFHTGTEHRVYDTPRVSWDRGVLIPYREASLDWIQKGFDAALVQWAGPDKVPVDYGAKWVGIHAGIADVDTPDFMSGIPALELVKFAKEEGVRVFAGDWHDPKTWGSNRVIQCGALCPTGFDNPGMDYGRVWFFDLKKDKVWYEVIPGPRFLSYTYTEICDPATFLAEMDKWHVGTLDGAGYTIFIKIKAKPDEIADAMEMARGLKDFPYVGGVRVEPDAEVVRRKARSAAAAARSGTTLKESLKQYLKYLDVPDGVSRKDVGRRVRKYLGI